MKSRVFKQGLCISLRTGPDHDIHTALRIWTKRRHQNKSSEWIDKVYFCTVEDDNWVFNAGYKPKSGRYHLLSLYKLIQLR